MTVPEEDDSLFSTRGYHVIGKEASRESAAGNQGKSENYENGKDVNGSFDEHCPHQLVKGDLFPFTQGGTFGHLSQSREDQVDQVTGGYRMVCVHQLRLVSERF